METRRIIRILILAVGIAFSIFLFAGGLFLPSGEEDNMETAELSMVTGKIQEKLNEIDHVVYTASKGLSGGVDGGYTQQVLDTAYSATPDAVYFCSYTPEGEIADFSPALYNETSPNAFKLNESLPLLITKQDPVMTEVSQYGNYPAFAIAQPVFNENGNYIGGIAALIRPFEFLDEIVSPAEENPDITFTIMQTDGLILYDVDERQVGTNLFTDDIFSGFPNLQNLGVKIAANSKGYGSYMYYPTGDSGGRPVKKLAYWDSAGLYGTEWRVIMFKEVLIAD